MKQNILVSVVIPTHNRIKLLENAIKSVIKQIYRNYEIIVVDDASTCNNEYMIKKLNHDKILYYKFDKNQGGNICRNKGVDIANGEYIAFLDDDDIWMNGKLEKQLNFMIENVLDLSYTGRNIIKIKDNNIVSKRYSFSNPTYQYNIKKSIMRKNFIGTTSTIMIKKNSFLQIGGFDINMPAMQDYEMYIRGILNGWKVSGIDEKLINYYIYLSVNSVGRNLENSIKAKKILKKKYNNNEYLYLLQLSLVEDYFKRRVKKIINYMEMKLK